LQLTIIVLYQSFEGSGTIRFKIGDFGIARTLSRFEQSRTYAGTEGYMAPEVRGPGALYGRKADMYSLGKVMLYLDSVNTPCQWWTIRQRLTQTKPELRMEANQVVQQVTGHLKDPFPKPRIQNASLPVWKSRWGMKYEEYNDHVDKLIAEGYGLVHVSACAVNSNVYYSAIWHKTGYPAWKTYWQMSPTDYIRRTDEYKAEGYYPVTVTGYVQYSQIKYTAIWHKSPETGWYAISNVTSNRLKELCDEQNPKRYKLKCLDGFYHDGMDRYAAIWEYAGDSGWGPSKWGLSSSAFWKEVGEKKKEDYMPIYVSEFISNGEEKFAVIWEKRHGRGWSLKASMTGTEFTNESNAKAAEGYCPKVISGYSTNSEVKYAAIWIKE
jgi:hypothetical protein